MSHLLSVGLRQVGDAVKVRVLSVSDGKLSLTMKEYKESAPKADFKPRDRGNRNARIDDIWSDSTEPEWQKYLEEATEGFDNVLELKL
jgi:predicted RNA-binding protein with RPS1 domain